MTAPRWIAEAIEVVTSTIRGGEVFPGIPMIDAHRLPTALIERLPLEAMGRCNSLTALMRVLTDGDPEVVELTEIYQGACRALDDAGVPYASGVGQLGDMVTIGPAEALGLADRIRWLAQQRPTRLDLQRVEAERDAAREEVPSDAMGELVSLALQRDTARKHLAAIDLVLKASGVPLGTRRDEGDLAVAVQSLAAERDQLQKMYEGASDDLDRERTAHQEAEAATSDREIALAVDLDNARAQAQNLKEAAVERNTFLRSLVEGNMPACDLRRALAELIGADDWKLHLADLERETLRAKVADQAVYVEQLEAEISALEDEIWEDEP